MNSHVRTGLTLGLCLLAAIIALTIAQRLARPQIELSRQQWLMQGLSAVLPTGPFDNDPLTSVRLVTAPELGSTDAMPIYTVFRDNRPLAAVLSIVAPDGYNGDIKLLLGVTIDGEIIGTRVTEHRETPGLGDDLEYRRSDWITGFDGQSLASTSAGDWDVRQQGGRFDAFTGATITPRAVIRAIHRALDWYDSHRQDIFAS
ncbi:MAG: electron transport complex subunit RsxG [Granulosicoccus sp.]|nr:electron transport complex subunit RsxG [Granulosicoccus sp.]